jgi:hypothetical protein
MAVLNDGGVEKLTLAVLRLTVIGLRGTHAGHRRSARVSVNSPACR